MAHWEQVVRLFDQHPDWTSTQLAKELGCHSAYVRATLIRKGRRLKKSFVKRAGKVMNPSGKVRKVLQDWERQACLDAYRGGEKLEAVAAEFGVTLSAISKIGHRAGEPPRVKGKRK